MDINEVKALFFPGALVSIFEGYAVVTRESHVLSNGAYRAVTITERVEELNDKFFRIIDMVTGQRRIVTR